MQAALERIARSLDRDSAERISLREGQVAQKGGVLYVLSTYHSDRFDKHWAALYDPEGKFDLAHRRNVGGRVDDNLPITALPVVQPQADGIAGKFIDVEIVTVEGETGARCAQWLEERGTALGRAVDDRVLERVRRKGAVADELDARDLRAAARPLILARHHSWQHDKAQGKKEHPYHRASLSPGRPRARLSRPGIARKGSRAANSRAR